MAPTLKLDAGEAGIIEVQRMGRAEMRAWYDEFMRDPENPSDSFQNAWARAAVQPAAAELESFIADYDALPPMVLAELTRAAGYTLGSDAYPLVAEDQIPAEAMAQAREATKRKPVAVQTPAGMWLLRPSGGTQNFLNEQTRFSAGKKDASRYEALRSLVIARALVPSAEVIVKAIDEYPGIPIVLEDALLGAASGGKAPMRVS